MESRSRTPGDRPREGGELAANEPTQLHVLVVLDGATRTWEALDWALERADASAVTVLYVIDPFESDHAGVVPPLLGYWGIWYADERARADAVVDAAKRRASAFDVPVEVAVERGRTADVAVRAAAASGADRIVVDCGDRNPFRRVTGTTAQRIARRSPVTVTFV